MATVPTLPMGPAALNITDLIAGDKNLVQVTLTSNGSPVDLTGLTVTAQARKLATDPDPAAITCTVTVVDAAAGVVQLRFPGADVTTALAGELSWAGVWDYADPRHRRGPRHRARRHRHRPIGRDPTVRAVTLDITTGATAVHADMPGVVVRRPRPARPRPGHPARRVTGPAGPASTVPGPRRPGTGPAGPASTVPGPAGPDGPAGPASTVPAGRPRRPRRPGR